MFNDNWYLFLLIVMLAFYADGNINDRESAVMLSILFALTLTNSSSEDTAASTSGASESNCFCDHSV